MNVVIKVEMKVTVVVMVVMVLMSIVLMVVGKRKPIQPFKKPPPLTIPRTSPPSIHLIGILQITTATITTAATNTTRPLPPTIP